MTLLPDNVTDEDLVFFVDRWVALLEREDYRAAVALVEVDSNAGWTADLIRDVIKSYADALPSQKVTSAGEPTDVAQRKHVTRWSVSPTGSFGEIWYDLNIDGIVSDLTATFDVVRVPDGVAVRLLDIHVM